MSYALSTTKRKFHRILGSISNSSDISLPLNSPQSNTSSSTTLTASHASPVKKPRLIRPQNDNLSLASQTAVGKIRAVNPTPPLSKQEGEKPHFTPWDRADFLQRLESFRHVYLWMFKPKAINEVQWAKRGWICVGKERVRCVSCAREVVIRLKDEELENEDEDKDDLPNEDWKAAARAQLTEKYAEMIISEHDEGCLWRARGCDTTIYRLPLAHAPTSLKNLLERHESLVAIASELPATPAIPSVLNVQSLCQQLSVILQIQSSNQPPEDKTLPKKINEQAMILALFGWRAESEHTVNFAVCNACFRRLGLWLFTPKPGSNEPIMSCLDVVSEHRDYCPWVNGASQSGSLEAVNDEPVATEFTGWELLVQTLKNLHQSKTMLSSTIGEGTNGAADEVGSPRNVLDNPAVRDAKDKERLKKLRKLKEVFQFKRVKGAGDKKIGLSRPTGTS